MDEKKFISFIIPAYNAEQTIKRCLESISFISRNDMEVLVIDDGSEDDTSKICNNLKDSRIHIISQKNSGVSSARNHGIEKAKGEYICFVDADDVINAEEYTEVINQIREDDDLIMFNYCKKSGEKIVLQELPESEGVYEREVCKSIARRMKSSYTYKRENTNPFGAKVWQYIYKKSFLEEHNLNFQTKLPYAEDLCFCVELLLKIDKIKIVDICAYQNNEIEGSASRRYRSEFGKNYKMFKYTGNFRRTRILYLYYSWKSAINHFTKYLSFNQALQKCENIVKNLEFKKAVSLMTFPRKTFSEKLEDFCYQRGKIIIIVLYKKLNQSVMRTGSKVKHIIKNINNRRR
ncbi:MAG: glycosyltransferase family 2 protein [Intestinibacter sp.]